MPLLSGIPVYRITDLPNLAPVPETALVEVVHSNANYKATIGQVRRVPVVAVSGGTHAAAFDTVIVVTGPSTVDLPGLSATEVGRTVVIKRLYATGPATPVVPASGQTIDGVTGAYSLSGDGMSVTLVSATSTGWIIV